MVQRLLLQLASRLRKPPFDPELAPEEDHHHLLQPDEHEAFHFLLASPDGRVHGVLRTLFSPYNVREIVRLRVGDEVWAQQRSAPHTSADQPASDASGPVLGLHCLEPWQRWQLNFSGQLQAPDDEPAPIQLDLTFHATTPPVRFLVGAYQQVQQDGRLEGRIRTPSQHWEGELISYRDHSWGQRGAGSIPGWMILDIPERLYVFMVGNESRHLFWMGRIVTPDGEMRSVLRPRITRPTSNRWQIEDRRVGLQPWTFEWLGTPGVFHIGSPGEEFVRSAPVEDDLFEDRVGPVRLTSPTGEPVIGFLEVARRLRK